MQTETNGSMSSNTPSKNRTEGVDKPTTQHVKPRAAPKLAEPKKPAETTSITGEVHRTQEKEIVCSAQFFNAPHIECIGRPPLSTKNYGGHMYVDIPYGTIVKLRTGVKPGKPIKSWEAFPGLMNIAITSVAIEHGEIVVEVKSLGASLFDETELVKVVE